LQLFNKFYIITSFLFFLLRISTASTSTVISIRWWRNREPLSQFHELLIEKAHQITQSKLALGMHMGPNAFCDTMDQLDGERFYLQPNFYISEKPYVFIQVTFSATAYFNSIFKFILINRGKPLSERFGRVVVLISRNEVITVSWEHNSAI